MLCIRLPIIDYVIGVILCLGVMISYIPQIYSLIKNKSSNGISEFSLILLNIIFFSLTLNSAILNYKKFECFNSCSIMFCFGYILAFFQIAVGFVMVVPLYLLFLKYKIRESNNKLLYNLKYALCYLIFMLGLLIVCLVELKYMISYKYFFGEILSKILGITSSICSLVLWIPQIYDLIKTQNVGSLNILMFLIQIPGGIISIILQILYGADWTIWLSYGIVVCEQIIIVLIVARIKYIKKKENEYMLINNCEFTI